MKEDFLSSKNTYAVNPDDLDIAFQGYRMYWRKEREAPFLAWRVKSSTLPFFVSSRNTSSQDPLERSVAWRDEERLSLRNVFPKILSGRSVAWLTQKLLWGELWQLGIWGQGSCRVLNCWKSLQICPAIFQTWKKSLNRDKVWGFLCFPRSLMITYLLTLSLEKYSVVLEKVLNFGSKNLYEPCRGWVRLRLESHYLLDSNVV